jgi:hypothetical protein
VPIGGWHAHGMESKKEGQAKSESTMKVVEFKTGG